MTNKSHGTFVLLEPSRIVEALVGLKNVRVLAYRRTGPEVELLIEQIEVVLFCPGCGGRAQIKDRPVVRYVDLPVFGTPMTLAWRKHRLRCPHVGLSPQVVDIGRSPDRGQELPADHPLREVGYRAGRAGPGGVGCRWGTEL